MQPAGPDLQRHGGFPLCEVGSATHLPVMRLRFGFSPDCALNSQGALMSPILIILIDSSDFLLMLENSLVSYEFSLLLESSSFNSEESAEKSAGPCLPGATRLLETKALRSSPQSNLGP